MTQITSASGVGQPTRHGKHLIARSMYGKGTAFIGASLLLKRQLKDEPSQYVSLNLLAQGVEVTLKAFLLFKDHSKYQPMLQKRFGHNLVKTADSTLEAFALKPLREPHKAELERLSRIYSKHMLRYGNLGDLLIAPSTIESRHVLHRIAAAIRLAQRELRRLG